MLTREKYRRVPDLYVVGTELELRDGTVMWLQALNPFEQDEARRDAAVARSRLLIALNEHDHDERARIRGMFLELGRDAVIDRLVDAAVAEARMKITIALRMDPDWKEKLEVLERSIDIISAPIQDAEHKMLLATADEYAQEVTRRLDNEGDFTKSQLEILDEDALWERYLAHHFEERGRDAALSEYRLTEMWYSCRCCAATNVDDVWDHAECDGHRLRVFETKTEVRDLPEAFQAEIIGGLLKMAMSEVEAKNSDRPRNSSESSPRPNEEAASTASTQTGTPEAPPGISSQPSTTPSLSSAGSS